MCIEMFFVCAQNKFCSYHRAYVSESESFYIDSAHYLQSPHCHTPISLYKVCLEMFYGERGEVVVRERHGLKSKIISQMKRLKQ